MRFKEIKERVRQCIKYGDFILSSGQQTTWLCDLLECRDIFPELLYELGVDLTKDNIFGIETGGYLIASSKGAKRVGLIRKTGEIYFGRESYLHSQVKGPFNLKIPQRVQIIDDVVTTEETFNKAIKKLDVDLFLEEIKLYAVLDRRKKPNMEITSLFTAKDFGL